MTSKRFVFSGGYLYDHDECIGHIEDPRFRQDFETILNKQHEEIIELREAMKRLMGDLMSGGIR